MSLSNAVVNCPICSLQFPAAKIELHVNECLDGLAEENEGSSEQTEFSDSTESTTLSNSTNTGDECDDWVVIPSDKPKPKPKPKPKEKPIPKPKPRKRDLFKQTFKKLANQGLNLQKNTMKTFKT